MSDAKILSFNFLKLNGNSNGLELTVNKVQSTASIVALEPCGNFFYMLTRVKAFLN